MRVSFSMVSCCSRHNSSSVKIYSFHGPGEEAIHLADGPISVVLFRVAAPGLVALPDRRRRHPPGVVLLAHEDDPLSLFVDVLPGEPEDDAAGVFDVYALFQVDEVVGQRPDQCLPLVHRNPEELKRLSDDLVAPGEILKIRVHDVAVVHVPGVAMNAELVLDQLVDGRRVVDRADLGDLRAEADPRVPVEGVDEEADEVVDAPVIDQVAKAGVEAFVRYRAEVVVVVHEENPALLSVPGVVPADMLDEPLQCELRPFSLLTRRVVVDEPGIDDGLQDLVAEELLNDALANMNGLDVPELPALNDVEALEASALEGLVLDFVPD